jgi:hypothetical protein
MVRVFLAIVSLGATKLSTWVAPAEAKGDPPTPNNAPWKMTDRVRA